MLAFSGGLDSTVLLNILSKCINTSKEKLHKKTLKIRAIHINHGLHKQSSVWEKHCSLQCIKYQIPFKSIQISIKDFSGGLEAAARRARYQALFNNLKSSEILLTAHHQNDQIETFFLLLKRGSGPHGLSGMQLHTRYKKNNIFRPFLLFKKSDIKLYAVKNKLEWIEDSSNADIKYDRNFLRIKIIPVLLKRWPNLINSIANSMKLCYDQEQLLYECLQESLDHLILADGSLNFTEILHMSKIKRYFILRSWFSKNCMHMPSIKQITYIWKNIILSKIDAQSELKIEKKIVKRFKKNLYFVSDQLKSPKKEISLSVKEIFHTKKVYLPLDLGILFFKPIIFNEQLIKKLQYLKEKNFLTKNYENTLSFFLKNKFQRIQENIFYLKNRCITIVKYPHFYKNIFLKFKNTQNILYMRKSINKKLKHNSIPPWERSRIPLLFYDNNLISALSVFITPSGYTKKDNQAILLYWKKYKVIK
ncbi:tRNA lysidine(34) synthetase TilS [Wigglesworthia glossinidia]|uniref:tRNA lysidine(34) synthetase TilS n=1 Tax=Wigglesworthia glossinidia TaxID=51229 RepID=UPI00161D531D|nr:tRNA lysidine(34) synthetase TilS [Wigglesworthia glossinidia]